MKFLRGFVLASALLFASITLAQQPQPEKDLKTKVYDSVAILYTQDEEGGMHMTCTATAYKKIEGGYRFVSAAHCVEGDADDEQKQLRFFVTSDKKNEKNFISATLVEAGNKDSGDDFSIFEVKTAENYEVTPLGDESKLKAGDRVIDVASPFGLGKQYFEGYISDVKVDRPAIDAGEVKWNDAMLIQIGGGPGSSGSAVVSTDQQAIVAFLVGSAGGDIGKICVPVSKFKTFEAKVDAKTYKKTEPKHRFLGIF